MAHWWPIRLTIIILCGSVLAFGATNLINGAILLAQCLITGNCGGNSRSDAIVNYALNIAQGGFQLLVPILGLIGTARSQSFFHVKRRDYVIMVVFMVLFSIQLAFTIASLVVAVVNFARNVAASDNPDTLIANVLDFIWFVISTALNLILWIFGLMWTIHLRRTLHAPSTANRKGVYKHNAQSA